MTTCTGEMGKKAFRWPRRAPLLLGTEQLHGDKAGKQQDPSAVQKAQCKAMANTELATLREVRIWFLLGNSSVSRGCRATVVRNSKQSRVRRKLRAQG